MKVEWTTACTKFSKEEMEIINEVIKMEKTNLSKLIRAFALAGLNYYILDKKMKENSALKQVSSNTAKAIFSKKKLDEINKIVEKESAKIPEEKKKDAIKEINEHNKKMKVFTKHNPVGAPSQKHGKRGRRSKKEMSL